MSGADEIPETAADLEAYVEEMRPKLEVTSQTREFFEFLLTGRSGSARLARLAAPCNRFQIAAGMSLMPAWARELSGFDHSTLADRALHEPLAADYARTLRWAFGTPPFRALAEQRPARGRRGAFTRARGAA